VRERKGRERKGKGASARVALVVLGMHRSGTSALAGILGLRGATLPKTQIPPSSRNPRGFFESEVLYALHDELLRDAGTGWDDLRPLPDGWIDTPEGVAWTARLARAATGEYGAATPWVLKDPRLCRLVPVWLRVFEALGVEPRFALPVRNPLACAASLSASDGISTNVALLLWLDHFLTAERDTRGLPRVFLTYDALLADPNGVVAALERALDVELPRSAREADADVARFISRDLQRQVADDAELLARDDVHAWVKDAYRQALRAAEGRAPAVRKLDAIRAELARAESVFGPALAASEASRKSGVAALEARLAEQATEHRKTTRRLMHWVADRVRDGDKPLPEPLRATIAALADAAPAEIPGLAATGLLLAELNLEIQELTAERARRAEQFAALAIRADRAEQELAASALRLAEQVRECDARQQEALRLRQQVAEQRDALRVLRGAAMRAARERSPARSGRETVQRALEPDVER
jgi:hypothetical protein